jgi:hypothetical protein
LSYFSGYLLNIIVDDYGYPGTNLPLHGGFEGLSHRGFSVRLVAEANNPVPDVPAPVPEVLEGTVKGSRRHQHPVASRASATADSLFGCLLCLRLPIRCLRFSIRCLRLSKAPPSGGFEGLSHRGFSVPLVAEANNPVPEIPDPVPEALEGTVKGSRRHRERLSKAPTSGSFEGLSHRGFSFRLYAVPKAPAPVPEALEGTVKGSRRHRERFSKAPPSGGFEGLSHRGFSFRLYAMPEVPAPVPEVPAPVPEVLEGTDIRWLRGPQPPRILISVVCCA